MTGIETRQRSVLPAVLAMVAAGCVYYNGVYNARLVERRGDGLAERGREAEAREQYLIAAAKAETILARHPRSKWASEATYLAGRTAALAGDCARGRARLAAFLATPAGPSEHRQRAQVAIGACLVRAGAHDSAATLLADLVSSGDGTVARSAALWRGRALLAMGVADSARALGRRARSSVIDWELLDQHRRSGNVDGIAELLEELGARGEYRESAIDALEVLWRAGAVAQCDRIARAHANGGGEGASKIALALARWRLDAGDGSAARPLLHDALRFARDSSVARDAVAALALLDVRQATTVSEAERVLRRARPRASGSPLFEQTDTQLLLVRVLTAADDESGASLFLAAEVARDSLRAVPLALALVRAVPERRPRGFVAPKALLAASRLDPAAAATYQRLLVERYPESPYARVARQDMAPVPETPVEVELFRRAWERGARMLSDSLRVRSGARIAVRDSARGSPAPP